MELVPAMSPESVHTLGRGSPDSPHIEGDSLVQLPALGDEEGVRHRLGHSRLLAGDLMVQRYFKSPLSISVRHLVMKVTTIWGNSMFLVNPSPRAILLLKLVPTLRITFVF